MARKLLVWLFLPFLFFLACRRGSRWQVFTLLYFDTVCEIKIFCPPSLMEQSQRAVIRAFSEVEELFSPGSTDVTSSRVLSLFRIAQQVFVSSKGSFDITVAPLSKIWGFRNKSFRIPSEREIQEALKSVGLDKVREVEGHLLLPAHMELDWGGIAKGWGVELAADALLELGVKRGFINAGGDLFCWGKNPVNDSWKIGIKHPRKNGFLGILSISDVAAATTGDYQRYFEKSGVRYHHIFDPHTGYPSRGNQSVTVVGPDASFCDALSTALFVSPHPEEILLLYPDYGAILYRDGGEVLEIGKKFRLDLSRAF